ncbi:porin family protein [Flavobacterium crassostreae]|uniref:Outer membrane protein beta-barrel domain-containing protein n=1 Tax=Flavobacterium crassostreae TaxID=1763534 RepID=A0A1B9E280_9FLAO|nr:porin family protein [Flavobacterium crassostreae]OCB76053.1 hypothetical protein LPBF_07005 [Flavobacterium crassostreae]
MKKSRKIVLASFLFSCLAFTTAKAQYTSSDQPKIGFKGGVNFSNMYAEDVDDQNVLTGFNAGLFAKLPIAKSLAIQPEVYYTTKGAEVTYDNAFIKGNSKFKVNYVEVPVLLVVNLTEKFNIHAGPYAAYMVSGKATTESSVLDVDQDLDTNDFNKFDAGIAAGVGIDLELLSFGVRYNYGLTKVGKERSFAGTNYTFPDAKNSVLNVYVGLNLN